MEFKDDMEPNWNYAPKEPLRPETFVYLLKELYFQQYVGRTTSKAANMVNPGPAIDIWFNNVRQTNLPGLQYV